MLELVRLEEVESERVDGSGQVDAEALDAADGNVVAGQGRAPVRRLWDHATRPDEELPAQGRETHRSHGEARSYRTGVGKRPVALLAPVSARKVAWLE